MTHEIPNISSQFEELVISLSINKNSIFFNITLFFVAMIITAHIIIYIGYDITKQQQIEQNISKYLNTIHRIAFKPNERKRSFPPRIANKGKEDFKNFPPPHRPIKPLKQIMKNKEFNDELKEYDLEISPIKYEDMIKVGELIATNNYDWELYNYKGYKYFYSNERLGEFFIKDNIKTIDKSNYIIALTILLNIVFVCFFIFLIKRLTPLQKLKYDIVKFSQGDLNIDTSCSGKDEISTLSNEFNYAICQIRELTNSRNLFLRNIMHELKTPITKGLLITDMLEEEEFKDKLRKAFARLEYLLNEFARIEKFTSKNIEIHKDSFRVVDIIDHSLDILLCDIDAIELEVIDSVIVDVDFELFSFAIKNLIDNAIKYGEGKPQITIKNNSFIITNIGKELSQPINQYNKPFNRKFESSSSGLGLGLYIVNSILKTHNLELQYEFKEEKNRFVIEF